MIFSRINRWTGLSQIECDSVPLRRSNENVALVIAYTMLPTFLWPYKTLFRFLPKSVISRLAKLNWRFAHSVPAGEYNSKYYGFDVFLDTQYPVEKRMLTGCYDRKIERVLKFFLRPNMTCIDVGANVGAVSLMQAYLVGSEGHVVSVEPGPLTANRLARTLESNGVQNVTLFKVGLDDKPGKMYWCLERGPNLGNATLARNGGDAEVEVMTLDNLVESSDLTPDFIKIDVEGMEFEVLRGGRECLARYSPILFFETLQIRREWAVQKNSNYYQELEKYLDSLGYMLFAFDGNGFRLTSMANTSEDTIAVSKNHAQQYGLI